MPVSSSGGIYIEIGGNADKLYDVLKKVKADARGIASDIAKQTGNAVSSSTANSVMGKVNTSFASLRRAVQASKADVASLNDRFRGMAQQMGMAGQQAGQFASAMQRAFQQRAASDIQRHLRDIQRQTGMSRQEMDALARSMGTTFSQAARQARSAAASVGFFAKALAAAGVAATFKTLANAGDYEHALWNMRKVTDENIDDIKKRIESLPASLGNVTDLAKGYYQTLSAGVTEPAKAMETLKTASQLAAVAEVSQSDAIKALTKMMAGFKGEIKDVSVAADTLLDIEQYGQTSVQELVPVIGDISGVAKLAGVSYKEMAAGLAVVTQTAGTTSQAATQLTALFTALIKPSEKMGKLINALGYDSGAALLQANGLAGGLNLLAQAAKASGVSLEEILGSTEAIKAQAALASGEYASFAQTLDGIGAKAGRTGEAFESYQHTFTGLWNTIKNSLFDIGTTFAGELVPTSKEGMEALQSALGILKDVAAGVGAIIAKIASWVGAIVKGIHDTVRAAWSASRFAASVEAGRVDTEGFDEGTLKSLYADSPAASGSASGGKPAAPAKPAAPKLNLPTLKNFKPPSFGGSGGGSKNKPGSGRSRSSGGAGAASQIESARERIQALREEVQKLNGETAGNSLDKKLREIESAGQKAKLPLKEIAALKDDYTKAFQGSVIRDFSKALLEVTGSAEEIRAAKIEETVEGWRKKFVEAKLSAEEMAPKLSALREGLAKKASFEDLQAAVSFYKELGELSGNYSLSIEKQNELLERQAELHIRNGIAPDMVNEWLDLKKLDNATDWLSGLRRGMKSMAKDAQDWGKSVESLWTGAADSMTDAFVTFCTTGKANFKDMANSIISDLIRMITRAMIIQPLMNALGTGISGLFGGGGSSTFDLMPKNTANVWTGYGWSVATGHALGGVLAGGSLSAFSGHVVDRPTLFSYGARIPGYASGAGLMGEAGPEAIMPLTRMSNGRLGVQSNGNGGAMQMQLTIVDKTQGGVGVENAQASQDGMSMDMLINQVEQGIVRRASSGRSPLMNFIDKTRGTSNARRLY